MKKEKSLSAMKKRNSMAALWLLILMLTAVMISGADSQAAGKGWKKAYRSFLKDWKQVENYVELGYVKRYFGKNYKFKRYFVCDVDGDGTPELFLYNAKMNGLSAVLTYKNGKITGLGYDMVTSINKKQKALVVHGHWHGAGGTGGEAYDGNEYAVYKIKKKKGEWMLAYGYYFDRWPNRYTFYNGKDDWGERKLTNKKAEKLYNSLYEKYVSTSVSIKKFKKYKFTDKSGLNPQ